jgi:long-chain-fatty-acid---luciferin-component ligase
MTLAQDIEPAEDAESTRRKLNERIAHYIPPRDAWNLADEAVFKPADLYRVPLEEARDMQLKAIKFTFAHHYRNNDFYHRYCEMRNVSPDDIRTVDDLDKIPLIPDTTFKQYPSGKDFARWLANVFTGDLPKIVIEGANPTFDDVINAFNEAGLVVAHSSGTSGRVTVIPRDMKTFLASQYAAANVRINTGALSSDANAIMLMPNPEKSHVFMATVSRLAQDMYKSVYYAVDYVISADVIQRAMSENEKLKGKVPSSAQSEMLQKTVDRGIQCLEHYDKTNEKITISGPPFLFLHVLDTLQKDGKSFDFGERGRVTTGGGWKLYEGKRITHADFRRKVQDVLGIPETYCLDGYGMCESNGFMLHCPEGHYLHAPYTYYRPLVLDDGLTPIGYGEWGRFAFLDAIAQSYPGFIISGDRVRLLERCPVCDRPGPVLEPEVQRAKGEEVRGCAEELRRIFARDMLM